MTTLTGLAARLEGLAPPQNGLPNPAQYEQAVRDAVADFGIRLPRSLVGALAIVSGTAAYDLPAGFVRLIRLESPARDVFRDASGLLVVPSAGLAEERYSISGNQIIFYPTPAYTMNRTMAYAAGYPYDQDTDTFVGLTEVHESAVLLKAQALALTLLSSTGNGGFSYQIGDVRVDKTAATSSLATQAQTCEARYREAVAALIGPVGMRSTYTASGGAAWRR